jgi:hypothetical protein
MSNNDLLPKEAQKAWDAYQAMGLSKQSYFGFLQELDKKYKEGGSPSIAENLRLEELLKVHDAKVAAFNEAMQAIESKDSRELLLKKLTADAAKIGMH